MLCTNLSVFYIDVVYGPNNVPSDQSGDKVPLEQEENLYEKVKKETSLKHACTLRESDLQDKTRKIEREFASLVTIAVMEMESQGVTPGKIALYLTNRHGLKPVYAKSSVPTSTAELKCRVEEVQTKEKLEAVFIEVLSDYYSWFNHDLMKDLIKEFCEEGQKATQRLTQFEESFYKYSNERVSENVEYGSSRQRDMKELVLKVDKKWEVARVEQLIHIQNTVAGILKIEKYTLYLRTVENGCFQMTFMISKLVAATVFPLQFPNEQKAALLEAGVIELYCDGYDLKLSTPSKESQDSDPEV